MINHLPELPGRSKGPSRSPSEYLLRPRSRSQNHVTLYEADASFGIAARAAQHNHSAPAWGGGINKTGRTRAVPRTTPLPNPRYFLHLAVLPAVDRPVDGFPPRLAPTTS